MKRSITVLGISAVAASVVFWLVAAESPQATEASDTRVRSNLSQERPEVVLGMIENPKVVEMLSLSAEQKTQLKEKIQEVKKTLDRLRLELEAAAREQVRLLSTDTTQMNELMQVVEKAGQIRTDIAKNYVRSLVEVRKLLTPEQQQKLRDILHKFQERRRAAGPGEHKAGKPPAPAEKAPAAPAT